MGESDSLLARIDTLEMRLTHQDLAIEDLNGALTRQWRTIDGLTRQILQLNERLQEVGASNGGTGGVEPPPPHY
jgi:SlyX protein